MGQEGIERVVRSRFSTHPVTTLVYEGEGCHGMGGGGGTDEVGEIVLTISEKDKGRGGEGGFFFEFDFLSKTLC
jgi:hypothetical protein